MKLDPLQPDHHLGEKSKFGRVFGSWLLSIVSLARTKLFSLFDLKGSCILQRGLEQST